MAVCQVGIVLLDHNWLGEKQYHDILNVVLLVFSSSVLLAATTIMACWFYRCTQDDQDCLIHLIIVRFEADR